ncbi:MAG: hypothetical protein H5T59_04835 [Anaerolineae bacterium]|nr:hypothetical protein [Anaerolineae bacterium]
MPKEPAIVPKLRKLGQQPVRLIIRTTDNPHNHVEEMERAGLRVHRVFRLIKAASVEGPASAALKLARKEWVRSVEEDQEVRTQDRPPKAGGKR